MRKVEGETMYREKQGKRVSDRERRNNKWNVRQKFVIGKGSRKTEEEEEQEAIKGTERKKVIGEKRGVEETKRRKGQKEDVRVERNGNVKKREG